MIFPCSITTNSFLHKSTIVYQELIPLYAIQKQSYLAMMPSEFCLTIRQEKVENGINLQVIELEKLMKLITFIYL